MANEPLQVNDSQEDGPPPEEVSLVGEFWLFLRENKKWWLLPMIGMCILLGALLILGSGPVAPFIYSIF